MMSFHDHDADLIMSLAEGRFAGDEGELRRELQACAECAVDLAAQETALAALSELRDRPGVELTELEAARLRRNLDEELDHRRTAQPVRQPRESRRFNWAPVFSVAAVLLALLLVAPALDLLGGGDDAGDTLDVAFDEFEAGADGDATREQATAESLQRSDLDLAAEDAADAPLTTEVASAAAAPDPLQLELSAILAAVEEAGGDTAALRSTIAPTFGYVPATPADACVEEGELAAGDPVDSATLGDLVLVPGEPPLTITVHRLATGEFVVVAHNPVTCEPVSQAP